MKRLILVLLCVASAVWSQEHGKAASKTYSNLRCGFSFNYPGALTVTEKGWENNPEYLRGCDLDLSEQLGLDCGLADHQQPAEQLTQPGATGDPGFAGSAVRCSARVP